MKIKDLDINEYFAFGFIDGELCVFDSEDVKLVADRYWLINDDGYAINQYFLMHRFVLGASKDDPQIDHKNRWKLDNRKKNLRFCTPGQNNANRPRQKNNTSGFKGVYRHSKIPGRWVSQISFDRKRIFLGSYSSKEEASVAYVYAASKLYGEFSCF